MRKRVSSGALHQFMKALGRAGKTNARVYFVGGATAVLLGWRETTIDVDLKLVPEVSEILRAVPDLTPSPLLEFFSRIEGELYKYPALDQKSFREAVERFAAGL